MSDEVIRTGGRRARTEHPRASEIVRTLGGRSIVMVGLMGCGKTTIGRRLAHRLGLPFIDSDDEIEAAAGKTIPEIFEDHGEPYFRERECRIIARLLSSTPRVLSTGGGAFMSPDTRALIRERGLSVWLKAELPILQRRVERRSNRPLAGRLAELMVERYPVYAQAEITIESRDVPHEVIVDEVIAAILDRQHQATEAHP